MEIDEKVIKGLECCLPMTTRDGYADCKHCPYDRKITLEGGVCECCHELMSDALELIKGQKTRVMTLEEVKQWCETHPHKQNPVWVEFQHGYGIDGWRVGLVNSGLLSWCKDKEARLWTSRPDDATREATMWK